MTEDLIRGSRNQKRVIQRREEAALRQEDRNKRSPTEQIKKLDALLGEGAGAVRERERLDRQLTAAIKPKKKEKKRKRKKEVKHV